MLFIYFLVKTCVNLYILTYQTKKAIFSLSNSFETEPEKGTDYEKRQPNNGEFKLFMCTNNEIHQSIFHSFYTLTMTKRSQHHFYPAGD